MTTRKFFLRLYLWCLLFALLIFIFQKLIAADIIFIRMADVRKDAIAKMAGNYSMLFIVFACIHFIFKLIRKRMKRALSNLHFFITLLTFILFIVVYAKLDAFNELPKNTVTRDMAYNNFIETETMLTIIWSLFYAAQIIFVIAIIHGYLRKNKSSRKIEEVKT